MGFGSLIDISITDIASPTTTKQHTKRKPKKPKEDNRGCEHCPLDKVKGIKKIMGKVEGKEAALFAQSPGLDENNEERELVGRAGRWFWKECKRVGITRDIFDIQNVQRCVPADREEGELVMRDPTNVELKCCSIHTERAVEKLKAKQILVLGKVAARQLLRTRSIPSSKIFWSDALHAKIYLLDHPSYFVRGYAPESRLKAFRETLQMFVQDRKKKSAVLSDQFGYLKSRDYRLVTNKHEAFKASRIIREIAMFGGVPRVHGQKQAGEPRSSLKTSFKRVSVDVEDDDIGGKRRVVSVCLTPKIGLSFVFVINHKDVPEENARQVRSELELLLTDPAIHKVMHHGCTDTTKLKDLEDIEVNGFDHDTNLSEYLRFSDAKSYGLDAIAERRFPEFSGYKQVVVRDMIANSPDVPDKIKFGTLEQQQKYIEKNKLFSINKLSLDTLRLYNGGDGDLTKQIEVSNKPHVKQNLLQLYIDLSFVLMRMEPNGPIFDFEQCAKLELLLPYKEKTLKQELKDILIKYINKKYKNKPKLLKKRLEWAEDYNPGSPDQVKFALYTVLDLDFPFSGKPNTQKATLLMLSRDHQFPGKQNEWRKIAKRKSTFVDGYKHCATVNNGRLHTRWWSTGTRTGRNSSGGEKKKKDPGVINLQNIAKDTIIQNLCCSDLRWKKLYKAVAKLAKIHKPEALPNAIEEWIRKHVPDIRVYLVLDYGQVEVRVMAQMAGDKNLKADCAKADIHTTVGTTMTGWDADRIAHDEATRTLTKNVHFGIMFGISKANLHKFVVAMSPPDMRDRISEEQIGKAYDRYFARYPGIKRFIEKQRKFAKEHGYVETMFGMKQPLDIREDDREEEQLVDEDENQRGSYWGNQAINGPVQGTAHQLLDCALINLYRQPEKYEILDVPNMDVHDAAYFSPLLLDLIKAAKLSKQLMEEESLKTVATDFPEIKWDVPIVTDAKAGLRLGCKVKIKPDTTVGSFVVEWWQLCRKQIIELNRELAEVQ